MSNLTSKAEATRSRILDAGESLFYSMGYTATGLDRILQQSGVTKGNFYYHFKSKEALLLAVVDRHFDSRAKTIKTIAEKGKHHPLKALFELMDMFVTMEEKQHQRGQITGCFFGNLTLELCASQERVREKLGTIFKRLNTVFTDLLVLAKRKGEIPERLDTSQMAALILAILEGALLIDKASQEPGSLEKNVAFIKCYLSGQ